MMKTLKLLLLPIAIAITMVSCKPQNDGSTQTAASASVLNDTISVGTAQRLVNNHDSTRKHYIDKGGLRRADSRSIWFSKEQIKQVLEDVESKHIDGIRFYLAAYDPVPKDDTRKINVAYMNFTTLVMVSTVPDSINGVKIHRDYFTVPATKGVKKGGIIMASPSNQGELCPPPEHCANSGTGLIP